MKQRKTIFGEPPVSFADRVQTTLNGLEEKPMETTRKTARKTILIAALAAALALALGAGAYAADVGGIQRNVQLWMHGDQTDATLVIDGDGTYYLYQNADDGERLVQSGGGIAYDIFGHERPLTEEEIVELLDSPTVVREDDGSVWAYYHDQKIELTGKFDADGICYVQLQDGGSILYMTVKYGEDNCAYSTSPHSFPNPRSLD